MTKEKKRYLHPITQLYFQHPITYRKEPSLDQNAYVRTLLLRWIGLRDDDDVTHLVEDRGVSE